MNFFFKIIRKDGEANLTVRYFTDIVTEADLATYRDPQTGRITNARTDVNLTLPDPAPTGDALAKFLANHIPEDFLCRMERIKLGVFDAATVLAEVPAVDAVTPIKAADLPLRVTQKGLDKVDNTTLARTA